MTIIPLNELTSKCTGCFACVGKCPTGAIHMELDNEGFYYPTISKEQCISCGLCERICPVLKSSTEVNSPTHIYSAFARDAALRQCSSSGGIFALLANSVLANGGIVYGAAFDKQRKEVCHTSTDNTPLDDIMRSKYVQSRMGDTYGNVENKLKCGSVVLFCGTPCQVKGLHSFLQEEYDKLLTVDFMCHGVPSTGLFKDVISHFERNQNSEVVDFTFREKDMGWRDQITKIYLSNGSIVSKKSSYFYYYYAFLNNYTLRKSCLDCSCYNTHEADITLADNWGIKNDDDKGVSLVFINTEKGDKLYNSISALTNTTDYKSDFKGYEIYHHNYSEKNRTAFFHYYLKHGFERTFSVFFKKAINQGTFKRCVFGVLCRVKPLAGIKHE